MYYRKYTKIIKLTNEDCSKFWVVTQAHNDEGLFFLSKGDHDIMAIATCDHYPNFKIITNRCNAPKELLDAFLDACEEMY